MSSTCPVCSAEQPEGLLCHDDTSRLERDLHAVAAVVEDLDISLSKQARLGTLGKSGLARERMPINLGAIDSRWVLANVLSVWAADVSGGKWHPQPRGRSATPVETQAAALLLDSIPQIRRHPAVHQLVDEVSDAVHQARRVVDRPADWAYLGQCYVETPDPDGRMVTCLNEMYGRPGASEVQCKVCGTEHPVAERRAWLLQRAQNTILSVKDASLFIGEVAGVRVSQSSIRGYLHRGKLAYRPGVPNGIRLGDLLTVVLDESERKTA